MKNTNANVKNVDTMLFKGLKNYLSIRIDRVAVLFPFVSNIKVKLEIETYFLKVIESFHLFLAGLR